MIEIGVRMKIGVMKMRILVSSLLPKGHFLLLFAPASISLRVIGMMMMMMTLVSSLLPNVWHFYLFSPALL